VDSGCRPWAGLTGGRDTAQWAGGVGPGRTVPGTEDRGQSHVGHQLLRHQGEGGGQDRADWDGDGKELCIHHGLQQPRVKNKVEIIPSLEILPALHYGLIYGFGGTLSGLSQKPVGYCYLSK
jgi:hypothetical protein